MLQVLVLHYPAGLRIDPFDPVAPGREVEADLDRPRGGCAWDRPGLRAEYFEGRTFDAPEAVRVDPAVDFAWPPAPRPIPRAAASGTVEIGLDLPAGRYRVEWVDPKTGRVVKDEALEHAGGRKALTAPAFDEDLALAVRAR